MPCLSKAISISGVCFIVFAPSAVLHFIAVASLDLFEFSIYHLSRIMTRSMSLRSLTVSKRAQSRLAQTDQNSRFSFLFCLHHIRIDGLTPGTFDLFFLWPLDLESSEVLKFNWWSLSCSC